jgi:hypothetical protein
VGVGVSVGSGPGASVCSGVGRGVASFSSSLSSGMLDGVGFGRGSVPLPGLLPPPTLPLGAGHAKPGMPPEPTGAGWTGARDGAAVGLGSAAVWDEGVDSEVGMPEAVGVGRT